MTEQNFDLVTDLKFKLNTHLKNNCDSLIYNIKSDWDFILLVTGTSKTRVGKTYLASQIGYYLAHKLKTPFSLKNFVFSGKELIKRANEFPKNSIIVYDEARAELESKRSIQVINQTIYDFFSECGMLNHIIILVLPDFFELQKRMAIGRSICLLNVFYRKEKIIHKKQTLQRFRKGYFQFYNERQKRHLYIKGKKNFDDYSMGKPSFVGRFVDLLTINEESYNKEKKVFLERERNQLTPTETKHIKQRDFLIQQIIKNNLYSPTSLSQLFNNNGFKIDRTNISKIVNRERE